MASRILVAVIGLPLLFAILLFCPSVCMAVVISLLSAIGAYELLGATHFQKNKALLAASCLLAAVMPLWVYLGCNTITGLACLLLFLVFAFSVAFASHETVTLGHVGGALFAGAVIPILFSSLLLLADLEHYRYYILLPIISAFSSDGAALFVGMRFGKHKLAPVLSPHKTVEGAVGGVLGSALCCVLYGIAIQMATGTVPYLAALLLYGVLGSAISQFGDLTFSYIKREFGLKDYGRLFLAHGGVLDRFDSVIFCAPLTAILVQLLPFFQF